MKWTSSKGITWYSHKKNVVIGRNKLPTETYFFRKEKKEDYVDNLPLRYIILETPSGMPVVGKR